MYNALVNIFTCLYPSTPLLYMRPGTLLGALVEFRGNSRNDGSSPIVLVTEDEISGCHPTNITVVVDFPQSQWRNYIRLLASKDDNKIILVEEEELHTGRFSYVKVDGWKTKKFDIDDDHIKSLKMARKAYKYHEIDNLKEDASVPQPFPDMKLKCDGLEGVEEHMRNMQESCLSGIFGYPASGKSWMLSMLWDRVRKGQNRVILFHCGSRLSQDVYQRHWEARVNEDMFGLDTSDINTLQDIIDRAKRQNKVEMQKKEEKNFKQNKKKGKMTSKWKARNIKKNKGGEEMGTLFVIVEDCPLLKDLEWTIEELRTTKMKLILAFKPHSEDSMGSEVGRYIRLLQDTPDCTAIVISSQPTNPALIRHIQLNEARASLRLEAKSLLVSSMPATIVPGPPVRYVNSNCSGQHRGYICSQNGACEPYVAVLSYRSVFNVAEEKDKGMPHILTSDERKGKPSLHGNTDLPPSVVEHPMDFRGCEASFIIAYNVSDDWLLEVFSRSRTHLSIIDSIPSHQDLWKAMLAEERVVPVDIPDSLEDLLKSNDRRKFLLRPTWDEAASIIGKQAMEKQGFLDHNTGAILCLSLDTWETLSSLDSLPSSSSPFTDWGYAWFKYTGEVPTIDFEERDRIVEILREQDVQWNKVRHPPVVLETWKSTGGLLESLSLSLTGSFLHLPLLKNILGDEDEADPFPQFQRGAVLLQRPIILIGEKDSCES
ncbi:unnamed protein product [Darwinula stevensoni]|uniref:Uncharacterized protein n=1 Tax=Darwinula stevensoni TaxID=69355 RepID=A0A7R9AF26_9CRUS|nr:unnamed protein product [Darwinula stevensoni]CAG0902678.1 unnamed protein product [Darwinula stevensoni]